MTDIVSIKVRISYEKPQELHAVLKLLKPVIKSYKADKGKQGQYKKAYLEIDIPDKDIQKSINSPLI